MVRIVGRFFPTCGDSGVSERTDSNPNMLVPDMSAQLTVVSTKEEARCQGVGATMLVHGLTDVRDRGYRYCGTDWRVTHLLS